MGNTLWQDAIALEMKNVRVTFEEYEGDVKDLHEYEHISGHLIFDIKYIHISPCIGESMAHRWT